MEFKEFGVENEASVLILEDRKTFSETGEQLCAELSEHYHVIVPMQDSFSGEAELQADAIESYVSRFEQGELYAICGTPEGWRLLRAILNRKAIRSEKVIMESGGNLLGGLIVPMLEESALEDRIQVRN